MLFSKGLSSQPIICVTNVSSEAKTDSKIRVTIVIVSLIIAQERQKTRPSLFQLKPILFDHPDRRIKAS